MAVETKKEEEEMAEIAEKVEEIAEQVEEIKETVEELVEKAPEVAAAAASAATDAAASALSSAAASATDKVDDEGALAATKTRSFFRSSRSSAAVKSETQNNTMSQKATKVETEAAGVAPVRKTSFKKIKGFLTGGSRRKVKNAAKTGETTTEMAASRRAELAASAGAAPEEDASTIYNVTLDDRSVATSNMSISDAKTGEEKYLLRMVLLLMDVGTRRFELLQLEFDSEKALVSDVLTQVPVSVTEESLRQQQYDGIVTTDGKEMSPDKALADFCKGNDVLVAVPKGLAPAEASRLSKPILSDKKVGNMLKSSGADPSTKKSTPKKQDPGQATSDRAAAEAPPKEEDKSMKAGGLSVFGIILLALAALVASYVHKYISAPVEPGHIVSPGIVLSKCGLNFWSPCERAYLEVQPGTVSYYEGKDLSWVIHGHTCPEDRLKDKTCLDGLEFKKDRSLWLGGEPIKWLEWYSEKGRKPKNQDYLTPWPFTEEPKIKSWVSRKLTEVVSSIGGDAKKTAGKAAQDAADTVKDQVQMMR